MALFTKDDLIKKAKKKGIEKRASATRKLIKEANDFNIKKKYDVFLSHSYSDAREIIGLKSVIEEFDLSVYVDWIEDRELDRSKVTQKTARRLKRRMNNCNCLFFATSDNTPKSKWIPWELGYFDGKKGKVAILPVLDSNQKTNKYRGQEYLELYPYVTKKADLIMGFFLDDKNKETLFINTDNDVYVNFESWLIGKKPFKRSN